MTITVALLFISLVTKTIFRVWHYSEKDLSALYIFNKVIVKYEQLCIVEKYSYQEN